MMPGKSILIYVLLLNLTAPVFATQQSACEEWINSFKEYGDQIEALLPGEPEDLMSMINKVIEAKETNDLGKATQLQKDIGQKVSALQKINPPSELEGYHAKLLVYCMAIKTDIDAVIKKDVGLKSSETRKCIEALLGLYEEMASLLIEHGCDNGDYKELKEKRIPELKEILKKGIYR